MENTTVDVAEAVALMRLDDQFDAVLTEAVVRKITVSAARGAGIKVSDEELQQAADLFRSLRKLHKSEDILNWLKSRGLSAEDLETYIEENLLIAKFKDKIAREANQEQFIALPEIQLRIREMVYRDWLQKHVR